MHKLTFSGKLLPTHDQAQAKAKLLSMLGVPPEQGGVLFSGKTHVIKRNLAADEAEHYQRCLAKRGIVVEIVPQPGAATATPFPTLIVDETPAEPARDNAPHAPTIREASFGNPTPPAAPPPAMDEITCPSCGEVQPKRIYCRACSTHMPFHAAAHGTAPRALTVTITPSPVAEAPAVADAPVIIEPAPPWFGFNVAGRFGRLHYLWAGLIQCFALTVATALALKTQSLALGLLALLAILLFSLRIVALRCHDLDRSGWWSVPALMTGIGLLLLLFPRGSPGENRYGRKPESAGIAAAIVGIAAFALVFVVYDSMSTLLQIQLEQWSPPPAQSAPATRAKVVIYTTSNCAICKQAKIYMEKKRIAFEERNVETSEQHLREFHARGGKGVPLLIVHGRSMHGFNPAEFERLLAPG